MKFERSERFEKSEKFGKIERFEKFGRGDSCGEILKRQGAKGKEGINAGH